VRLDEEDGAFRIHARCEPVQHHLMGVRLDFGDLVFALERRKCVDVSDGEEALVILVLELHPVGERSKVVAQM
jgi:hypothetical protein